MAPQRPYYVSIFSYAADKVTYNEKVPQDHSRTTEDDEEQLYHCYKRIVLASDEQEAEAKYLAHIQATAVLPDHYQVSVVDDEDELESFADDDEDGYRLYVVK